ncbi:MAG: hypothetical protein Q9207_002150 [Kuettlingeria erythrocarpa]
MSRPPIRPQRATLAAGAHLRFKRLSPLTYAANRPETEAWTTHLAHRILSNPSLRARALDAPLRILDLCTGTGCIPLLLHSLFHRSHHSLEILGIDISCNAVNLARHNLSHNVNKALLSYSGSSQIGFATGDVFKRHEIWDDKEWDIVVSNPPYISPDGYDRNTTRSVRNWEPKTALVPPVSRKNTSSPRRARMRDEDVGDMFYPRIISIARGTKAKMVATEVGDMAQAERVAEMLLSEQAWKTCEIWRDGITGRNGGLEEKELGAGKVVVRGEGNGRVVFAWRD